MTFWIILSLLGASGGVLVWAWKTRQQDVLVDACERLDRLKAIVPPRDPKQQPAPSWRVVK